MKNEKSKKKHKNVNNTKQAKLAEAKTKSSKKCIICS